MRNTSNNGLRSLYFVGGLALVTASLGGCGSKVPNDADASADGCTAAPSTVQSWFDSNVIALDGTVGPADSENFVEPTSTTIAHNCAFYEWSEHMFLWLTSPAPPEYGGVGRVFNSGAFFDVSPATDNGNGTFTRTFLPHQFQRGFNPLGNHAPMHPPAPPVLHVRNAALGAHGLPVVTDKTGRLFELAPMTVSKSGLQTIRGRGGDLVEFQRAVLDGKGHVQFFGRANELIALPPPPPPNERAAVGDTTVVLQRINIGNTTIIVDPSGNVINLEQAEAFGGVLMAQNQSLVYYAVQVNDVYAYFRTGLTHGAILNSAMTPPNHFPLSPTEMAPIVQYASNNGVTFPDEQAMAVEVKSAWVEAINLPSYCTYITMTGTIPVYTPDSDQHWSVTSQKTTTLALIGMHVVGTVQNHAEMIWATFEHFCNSPLVAAGYKYNSTSATNVSGPVEQGPWLLSSSDNPLNPNLRRIVFDSATGGLTSENHMPIYPDKIGPSDTARAKPWGMPGTSAASNTQIIAMNNSVRTQLASGDSRWPYIMTGATWRVNGMGGSVAGTSQTYNTTMETYTQSNCLSCHSNNDSIPGDHLGDNKNSGLSHIFGELSGLF